MNSADINASLYGCLNEKCPFIKKLNKKNYFIGL